MTTAARATGTASADVSVRAMTGARNEFEHAGNDGFEHKPDKEFGHSIAPGATRKTMSSCTGT
jgi:hypothetical protein